MWPLSFDRYAYVLDNPVNLVDPSGQKEARCDADSYCGTYGYHFPPPPQTLPTQTGISLISIFLPSLELSRLTDWGERMVNLYYVYARSCGWWNRNCTSPFSVLDFLTMILAFEFQNLNLVKEQIVELEHAAAHWYYIKCDYETAGSCGGITPTDIFNWVGAMESARRRFNAWMEGKELSGITKKDDSNLALARKVVASIVSPPDPEWKRTEGNYWNGNWDPVSFHPFTWGNKSLFLSAPTSYVFRYPPSTYGNIDNIKNPFYVLTLNQSNTFPRKNP